MPKIAQNLAKSEEDIEENVANETNENQPGHLLEIIDPPKKLSDIIKYLELGAGAIHPIEKAERQVDHLSMDFEQWLNDDVAKFNESWQALKKKIDNPDLFLRFNKSLHVIKGNAEVLNNKETGELAATLCRLVERTCKIDEHIKAIELLVDSINICAKNKQKDETKLDELKQGFDIIIDKKIAKI